MIEGSERQIGILRASSDMLLRYGARKVSMDDVAKQAGISRPGLYLHYANKDALLRATIDFLLSESIDATRKALATPGRSLESRLADAFDAMAAESLAPQLDEVLEAAERLTGRPAAELENTIIAEFAVVLETRPADDFWRRNGDTPESVATVLYATSAGLKRLAQSKADYMNQMNRAIGLIFTPNHKGKPST